MGSRPFFSIFFSCPSSSLAYTLSSFFDLLQWMDIYLYYQINVYSQYACTLSCFLACKLTVLSQWFYDIYMKYMIHLRIIVYYNCVAHPSCFGTFGTFYCFSSVSPISTIKLAWHLVPWIGTLHLGCTCSSLFHLPQSIDDFLDI